MNLSLLLIALLSVGADKFDPIKGSVDENLFRFRHLSTCDAGKTCFVQYQIENLHPTDGLVVAWPDAGCLATTVPRRPGQWANSRTLFTAVPYLDAMLSFGDGGKQKKAGLYVDGDKKGDEKEEDKTNALPDRIRSELTLSSSSSSPLFDFKLSMEVKDTVVIYNYSLEAIGEATIWFPPGQATDHLMRAMKWERQDAAPTSQAERI